MSSDSDNSKKDRTAIAVWQTTTHWMGRTIAVSALMFAPGFVGWALDKRLGTNFIAVAGFVVGICCGTVMLLILVKQFAPPARGKPLLDEEEIQQAGEKSDEG